MLSVPIMWTAPAPRGAEPLGVVNLSDRRSGQPFTAGDQKLIAAIATQIGTAIQNTRLVRASVEQQRLAHEMQLAHDLQMKLLPNNAIVAPHATVAARVVPAESVGGDFYNLFRLGGGEDRRDDRRRLGPRLSGRAHHGADDERGGDSLADDDRSRRDAARAHVDAARRAGDDRDVHLGVLRGRSIRRRTSCGTPTPGIRTRSCSPHGKDFERLAASDPPHRHGRAPSRRRRGAPGARATICSCCSPTASATRATARASAWAKSASSTTIRAHRDETPAAILDRVFEVLDAHITTAPRRDDLTIVLLRT